jgi:predicted nucleotidyltransferase
MQSRRILQQHSLRTRNFLEQVQHVVHAVVPESDVILYGSRARGDARPTSDWDFLILLEDPINRSVVKALRDRLYDLELETDNIVSSIIRTHREWNSPQYEAMPFKQQVEQEGIVL